MRSLGCGVLQQLVMNHTDATADVEQSGTCQTTRADGLQKRARLPVGAAAPVTPKARAGIILVEDLVGHLTAVTGHDGLLPEIFHYSDKIWCKNAIRARSKY